MAAHQPNCPQSSKFTFPSKDSPGMLETTCGDCGSILATRTINESSQEGKKNDTGKPRLSLVHSSLLRACARALEHGLDKYGVEPNNWQKVSNARARYTDAFLRHAHNLADGIEVDPDSGLLELDCLAANLMFLCWLNENPQLEVPNELDHRTNETD